MSNFLDPIYFKKGPADCALSVPSNEYKNLKGVLHLSKNGYVYSAPSKSVVWIKFLALGIYLPLRGMMVKCIDIASRCFGGRGNNKNEVSQALHLTRIAWKAVLGPSALLERVEDFAMAEIDFNHSNRNSALALKRSTRFSEGRYMAPCMQPLFHQSEAIPASLLQKKIDAIKTKKEAVDREIAFRYASKGQKIMMTIFTNRDPEFQKLEDATLANVSKNCTNAIQKQENLLERSKRCSRYAAQAILNQNCCPTTNAVIKKHTVTTGPEITCCGETCFKQERYCGIVYKIDCCFTRCWAIDCLCCFCCFWPDGRSACILA